MAEFLKEIDSGADYERGRPVEERRAEPIARRRQPARLGEAPSVGADDSRHGDRMCAVWHWIGHRTQQRPMNASARGPAWTGRVIERAVHRRGYRLGGAFLDEELADVGRGASPVCVPPRAPLWRLSPRLIHGAVNEAERSAIHGVTAEPLEACGGVASYPHLGGATNGRDQEECKRDEERSARALHCRLPEKTGISRRGRTPRDGSS